MIVFLSLLFSVATGSDSLEKSHCKQQVTQLKNFPELPEYCSSSSIDSCGASVFWNIVKLKLDAVPYLIDFLDDTTKTKISVHTERFDGYYTVADVAYVALFEIVYDLPTDYLLDVKDWDVNPYYWGVLQNGGIKERRKLKRNFKKWYRKRGADLVFTPCSVAKQFHFGSNPNGGYYLKNSTFN